jgi:hypothetical protein
MTKTVLNKNIKGYHYILYQEVNRISYLYICVSSEELTRAYSFVVAPVRSTNLTNKLYTFVRATVRSSDLTNKLVTFILCT